MRERIKGVLVSISMAAAAGMVMAGNDLPLDIPHWDVTKSTLMQNGMNFDDCLGGERSNEVCYLNSDMASANAEATYRLTFGSQGNLKAITEIMTPAAIDSDAGIREVYRLVKSDLIESIGVPASLRDASGQGEPGNPSVVQNWFVEWASEDTSVWLQIDSRIDVTPGTIGYREQPVLRVSYREPIETSEFLQTRVSRAGNL